MGNREERPTGILKCPKSVGNREECPTGILKCPKSMGNREEIMEKIKLRDEYIKLGQALKASGMVESGVDAKFVIENGFVRINGQVEYQRGKKLRSGDIVTFKGNTVKIEERSDRYPLIPKKNGQERGNNTIHDN
jgi:ribosome-associated protein